MSERKPLYPVPIPIMVVSGPHGAGKTVLGLSHCPQETCVFDEEESSATYESVMGIKKRLSMGREMLARYPHGYRPIQLYEWFLEEAKKIRAGEYRVIMIDPISELEDGLAEWVRANPSYFKVTHTQMEKNASMHFWPHMKATYKQLALELAAKCELLYITVHLKREYVGSVPTGAKVPRGKETLEELASLYLLLDRKVEANGRKSARPSAVVRKDRLLFPKFNEETGEMEWWPALSPFLPVCTPAEIRKELGKGGIDYEHLSKSQRVPEERLSDDERLLLETHRAEKLAEQAGLQLAYYEKVEVAKRQQQEQRLLQTQETPAPVPEPPSQSLVVPPQAPSNGQATVTEDRSPEVVPTDRSPEVVPTGLQADRSPDGLLTQEQLAEIQHLHGVLTQKGVDPARWAGILAKRLNAQGQPITSENELSQEQATTLIANLHAYLEKLVAAQREMADAESKSPR